MKKIILSLLFVCIGFLLHAQTWTYDFGTGTGTHTSATASTSFLPTPPAGGGTARVRVGTNPGSIKMVNPGAIALGSNTELQITSNTNSTSTTKFSVYDYTAAKAGYVKFNISFVGGTNGVYNFTIGNGANFSDNIAISNPQIFTGLRWNFGASNTISYEVLNNTTWGTTGITDPATLFVQDTTIVYTVEVYYNNATTSADYTRAMVDYNLANATWDLWVNGVRVGTNLAKAALATDTDIDSYAFNHQVSKSAPGTLFIDDIEYSNALPFSGGGPATQLIYENLPSTGVPNNAINTFLVKAVGIDGVSVDPSYTTDITITKATGPGNLTGTTVVTPINGVATFNNIQFDATGTYTITASSGSLTSVTSTDIVVADGTVSSDHFRSITNGNWSDITTWESSHDSTSWIAATLAPDANASSIVVVNTDSVFVSASTNASNLLVHGVIKILATQTLTINNDGDGSTKDMIITNGGVVLNVGTYSLGSGATWQVENGGTFIHNSTSGISTPLNSATLDAASNFIYRGSSVLGITPSISGKTYGNLLLESESGVWSCNGSGSGAFNVNGFLSIGQNVAWNISGYTGTMTVVDSIHVYGSLTSANITLAINKPLTIYSSGTVIVPSGKTLNLTNASAIIKSDATGTGSIGNSAGSITGNVTQELYIPAKAARRWSFIASPFSQTIANSWQQQIHVTGAGTGGTICPSLSSNSNGFDATSTNTTSMYTYNASNLAGNRWTALANTLFTSVGQGVGFRVNVRGDRSLGCSLLDGSPAGLVPSAVTLRSTGAIDNTNKNLGSFTINYPNVGASNYVLIGNPYPSALSFSALQTDNVALIDNNYAIYLPANAAGIYTYWDGTSGKYFGGADDLNFDNSTGNIISNGQAIFVKAINDGTLSLGFNEAQKASSNKTGYYRTARNFNEQIKVSYLKDNQQVDEVLIRYANDAGISNTELGKMDITSMNSGTSISSLKANHKMVVQTRDLNTLSNDEVWLNVDATESGNYQLNFSNFENFAGTTIFLKDNYTNTIQDVKQNSTYSFTIDKDNAATFGSTRFSIVYNRTMNPVYVNNIIKMYPNPANKNIAIELPQINNIYTIKVTDIVGKVVMQVKLNGGTQHVGLDKLTAGTYIVEVTDNNGNRTTEKLLKQ